MLWGTAIPRFQKCLYIHWQESRNPHLFMNDPWQSLECASNREPAIWWYDFSFHSQTLWKSVALPCSTKLSWNLNITSLPSFTYFSLYFFQTFKFYTILCVFCWFSAQARFYGFSISHSSLRTANDSSGQFGTAALTRALKVDKDLHVRPRPKQWIKSWNFTMNMCMYIFNIYIYSYVYIYLHIYMNMYIIFFIILCIHDIYNHTHIYI